MKTSDLELAAGAVLYRLVAFKQAVPLDQYEVDRHQALYEKLMAKSANDPAWCYFCDRPNNDCACEVVR